MRIVIRDVTAVTAGTTIARNVNLLIEESRISAITKEEPRIDEHTTLIEGKGKLAIPGLINAHTHLPMVLFRGLADDLPLSAWLEDHIWPLEKRLRPEDVYWASLLGLIEMIRSGTTLFADMYFHIDEIARAVEKAGIRAVLSYGIIASEFDAHGKEELDKAAALIDRWHNAAGGRIKTGVSPHAPYSCGEKIWERALALAADRRVILHTHVAETEQELRRCRRERGMSPVAWLEQIGALNLPLLAAHCVHLEKGDIERLATHGVTVAHCPKSNAKLGSGIAPIARLRRAGVRVALGTDGAASNNGLNMIEEMRAAALLQKAETRDPTVLPAAQVFHMATVEGANALNGEMGTLAAGKEADIVLIDIEQAHTLPAYHPLSTLIYAVQPQAVTDVIVAGRFLLRAGSLTTIDEEEVKERIKRLKDRYVN